MGYAKYSGFGSGGGGGGGGVTSLNTLTGDVVLAAGSGIVLTPVGNTITISSPDAGGTVTSVALAAPTGFTVSGSPVTTAGTLTLGLDDEPANTFWGGPASGPDAQPAFRALVPSDLPTPIDEPANTVFAGPVSGPDATPTFRSLVVADIPDLPPGKIVSGSPNMFSGFDGAGDLFAIPNWNIDTTFTPSRYGLNATFSIDPAAAPAYSQTNRISSQLIPTANAPGDAEILLQMSTSIDPTNTGFGIGAPNGLAVRILDLSLDAPTSGVNGQVQTLNIDANLGDGVITGGVVDQYTPVNSYTHLQNGFTVHTIRGMVASLQSEVGSTITNGYGGIDLSLNINGAFDNFLTGYSISGSFTPTNAYTGSLDSFKAGLGIAGQFGYGTALSDSTQFQSGSLVTGEWISANLGPVFFSGSAVRSYSGVNINPQFNASITDDLRGVGVFFNGPTAGSGITGLDVSITNATSSGGSINGLNININGSTDTNPQGVTGIQSNARMSVNAQTQLVSAQGFQIGNRIEHAYSVPAGSPVTGTDSLGNNFAGDFIVQDNVANGGFGIGWNSVGFIASVGVAAGKTVDKASVFLPAMSLPDPGFTTGGAITDLAIIRIYSPLAQGGTVAFTDVYGLQINPQFGNLPGTNAWGIWVGDSTADNWFKKNVVIGGSTGKPTGAYAFDVTGDSSQKGLMGLEGATSGLFTQKAATTTTPYGIAWPAAQGAASTVLQNDGAGNLSWGTAGTPTYTAFTLSNNQVAPANVTGFTVDAAVNNGFVADYSIVRSSAIAAAPSTGLPDTAFNSAMVSNGGFNNSTLAIAAMSDSSVVVGGNFSFAGGPPRSKLVKFSDAGIQDSTFYTNLGTGGVSGGPVTAVAVLSTTDVIFGGSFTNVGTNSILRLAKVSSAGIYDATFNGNLGTAIGGGGVFHIHEQANGQILVCGSFTTFNGNATAHLVRLNADGTEDTAFSANLGTGFDNDALWVYEQADGKILVTGAFTALNGSTVAQGFVRLNSDGTLDTTLNTALGTGFNSVVYGAIEQTDTSLIIFGDFSQLNGSTALILIRTDSAGTIDSTYSTNLGTFDAAVRFAQLQSDGKLVVGGEFTTLNGNGVGSFARINTDGTPDATFEGNQTTGGNSFVLGLVIKPNLKITYVGLASVWNGTAINRIYQMDSIASSVEELDQVATIYGAYSFKNAAWMISDPIGAFDDAGVVLSISTTGTVGQLQYTSSNMSGTIGMQEMSFLIGSKL